MNEELVPLRGSEAVRPRGLPTHAWALACVRASALAGMLVVLGIAPQAHGAQSTPIIKAAGVAGAATTPARTGTTPTRTGKGSTPIFPIPATARPQPSPGSSTATGTGTPGVGSPTTTYVPSGGTTTPSPGAAGRATPIPTVTAPSAVTPIKTTARARARAKHSRTLSPAAIAIAVAAALLVLACSAWGLARRRAFEPHWALSLRHALAEAGLRSSLTWAEFVDWARIGR